MLSWYIIHSLKGDEAFDEYVLATFHIYIQKRKQNKTHEKNKTKTKENKNESKSQTSYFLNWASKIYIYANAIVHCSLWIQTPHSWEFWGILETNLLLA